MQGVEFAEDTELFRLQKMTENEEEFQEDLIKVGDWVTQQQINFNEGRHEAMLSRQNCSFQLFILTDQPAHLGKYISNNDKIVYRSLR